MDLYSNITTNFKWYEVFQSDTAARLGIDNVSTDPKVLELIKYLFETCVQPVRDILNAPLRINSGFRCKALNAAIGGSPTSFHSIGGAVDLSSPNFQVPLLNIFDAIHERGFYTELIAEEISDSSGWIHVALVKGRTQERQLKYKLKGQPVVRATYSEVLKYAFNR